MGVNVGFAIAVHGGAGLIARHSLTAAREEACRAGLHTAVVRGQAILAAGGSALDAVVEAAQSLEDDPLFNAGRGGVLNAEGFVEMDAALMQGMDRTAGAITCATTIRNPILGARAVLEDGRHVLLSGAGANDFGAQAQLPLAERGYFITPARAEQLEKMKAANAYGLDHGSTEKDVYGTIGAVACDAAGHVAAATSTGGMVNQSRGRIGDTPLIGAGTYAWDQTAAISGTGHGEAFIRLAVAHRISAYMELGGLSVVEACDRVVHHDLPQIGGAGGVIAVDASGNLSLPFNTGGMFRAWAREDAPPTVRIW